MAVTSKTGLLLSLKNPTRKRTKEQKPIEFKNIVSPAPFILRPFAGLYNPFPYGCSVLCNHPADCEAKGIVRRAKQAWANEIKAVASENRRLHKMHDVGLDSEDLGAVPEELFRRYTETDSRPLTPTPHLSSCFTGGGRRCVTPDPIPTHGGPSAERTLLVLDLRRSQSHETLTWHEEKNESPPPMFQPASRSPSPSSISSKSRVSSKRTRRSIPKREAVEKPPVPKPNPVPELLKTHIKIENEKLQLPPAQIPKTPDSPSDKEGDGLIKRRGKPRKKRKKHSKGDTSVELDREFKGFPEPGETQRQKALAEALRMTRVKSPAKVNKDMNAVKKEVPSSLSSVQSLLTLPRTFSRQSARFELPLDSSCLERMAPLDYIKQHVIVTRDRRLFYNLVFDHNREKYEEEDEIHSTEQPVRKMFVRTIGDALGQIMGRQLSGEDLTEFEDLINWSEMEWIDFRTWSGISALCERLLGPKYCTKYPSKDIDRCHDIEKADFDTLPRKLQHLKLNPKLEEILVRIKHSG